MRKKAVFVVLGLVLVVIAGAWIYLSQPQENTLLQGISATPQLERARIAEGPNGRRLSQKYVLPNTTIFEVQKEITASLGAEQGWEWSDDQMPQFLRGTKDNTEITVTNGPDRSVLLLTLKPAGPLDYWRLWVQNMGNVEVVPEG